MRLTTVFREEGFAGTAGGWFVDDVDDDDVAVWGFDEGIEEEVEVDDEFTAISRICRELSSSCFHACPYSSPGHLPAALALSQGLGGDTAAMSVYDGVRMVERYAGSSDYASRR